MSHQVPRDYCWLLGILCVEIGCCHRHVIIGCDCRYMLFRNNFFLLINLFLSNLLFWDGRCWLEKIPNRYLIGRGSFISWAYGQLPIFIYGNVSEIICFYYHAVGVCNRGRLSGDDALVKLLDHICRVETLSITCYRISILANYQRTTLCLSPSWVPWCIHWRWSAIHHHLGRVRSTHPLYFVKESVTYNCSIRWYAHGFLILRYFELAIILHLHLLRAWSIMHLSVANILLGTPW
jgi:hypothetical protein